jgi:hypothetical protein
MPPDPEQTARLRELHDDFAWKVNAAVAEGRDDLIGRLSDEYVEQALRMLAGGPAAGGTACGGAGTALGPEHCTTCAGPRTAPVRRRRWLGAIALGWRPHR